MLNLVKNCSSSKITPPPQTQIKKKTSEHFFDQKFNETHPLLSKEIRNPVELKADNPYENLEMSSSRRQGVILFDGDGKNPRILYCFIHKIELQRKRDFSYSE